MISVGIGIASTNPVSIPVQVKDPAGTGTLTNIVAIAAGQVHSLAVDNTGAVFAWGGGLAFDNGRVYASSGFREVVALDAGTGVLVWRARTDAPVHAAPTVFGGRVFVVDVEDELFAFDVATGLQDWTYQALTEPARILAASSPAVDNETVVASFASGELVAVRTGFDH